MAVAGFFFGGVDSWAHALLPQNNTGGNYS